MPKLLSRDIKRHISYGDYSRIYLFYGPEKYLVGHYTDMLIDNILGENDRNFNFVKFSGEKMNIDNISDSVESVPLMSPVKCVLIENMCIEDLNKADLSKFNEMISDIPPTTVLIISNRVTDIDIKKSSKWKKLINDIEKIGIVCEFSKLGDLELEKYIVSAVKKRGCNITNINAAKLIKICGNDLINLNNEIEKLCAFSNQKEINEDIINKIATKSLESNVFALSNQILARDYKKAYMQLELLLSKKEDPISILSVLASAYIDMYRVKLAIESGYKAQEISKYFDYKGKDFRIKSAQINSKNLSMDLIKESVREILYTDILMKSSKADKKMLLQRLISKLLLITREGKNY